MFSSFVHVVMICSSMSLLVLHCVRKCAVEGCIKIAQSPTMFCIQHGGGKRCQVIDCAKVQYVCYHEISR